MALTCSVSNSIKLHRTRSLSYYKTHKDQVKVYFKKYYVNTIRNKRLLKEYGITLETYNNLFNQQKGLCLGCYKHQSQFKERFAIDHCHKTAKIRGLLCRNCNLVLGNSFDNIDTLKRLIEYLERG